MSEKAKTIIFVHGIGNKPTEDVLKCQWDRALFGFELGERSRLAYWVNRAFYPNPSPVTCQTGDVTRAGDDAGGVQVRSVSVPDTAATLDEEIAAIANSPKEVEVLERLKAELLAAAEQTQDEERAFKAAGVQQKVLPLPRFLRKWITQHLTRALLRDVHEYFFVPERREAMRQSVLERISVGGGPFVVIAHSQGSMIAYDVLEELAAADVEVPLFVTIGSPLGLTEVQDQLKRLKGKETLPIPACVGTWVNVADPLDPVCLDKKLGGDFRPKGKIQDFIRWNKDSPRDPHSGSGYLRLSDVQSQVQQHVDIGLFQPVAQFTIARDLAKALETGGGLKRHPVLIEIAEPDSAVLSDLGSPREKIVSWLLEETRQTEDSLNVELLRHYVSANLTRPEAERLASRYREHGLQIRHLWKNSGKRALLHKSINTVQARPAHRGYDAAGTGIRWAVLDSGIRADHPHFKRWGNIEAAFDCTVRGALRNGGTAEDRNGHGTHVAGIIAGESEKPLKIDGQGDVVLSGMAPAAKLVIYKVLDDAGNGYDAWIIKALDHIANYNERSGSPLIQGVNLSLGGGFDPSVFGCGHTPLCAELRRLWNQGVVVVLAAGNEGFAVLQGSHGEIDANMDLSIGDPANLDEAIAVGSVNKTNPHTFGISYFSSRGPTADGRQKPDLVAPGERILSCRHDFVARGKTVEGLYVEMSGTSMAAPHVSGIIASYLSSRREFIGFPTKVKEILLGNCTDLKRDPMHQGAGLPNLVKMLINT